MARSIDDMMDFFLEEKGETILINGIEQIGLVSDSVDKINYYDDKLIRTAIEIKTGNLINYQDSIYMIISQIDQNKHSYCGKMRRCNYEVAFNWIGNVKWFKAIVEAKVFSVDTGNYMTLPEGNIYVYVQENVDTRDISLDKRFYYAGQPFKVIGKDHSSKGIVKLFCKVDAKNEFDDVENNIADRWKYEIIHTYMLTIDNGNTANVLINDVIQLNCTVTDNGQTFENPAITYISSDPSIIAIDNLGKVMGINGGQATITARLTYNPTVVDAITITTVEEEVHNYSITLEGESSMTVGQSKSYVARFYDNGIEVFDQSGTWSITNQDGTTNTYAAITATTGNSVTVKADRFSNKYIILICKLGSDTNIKVEKTIQIKSLW